MLHQAKGYNLSACRAASVGFVSVPDATRVAAPVVRKRAGKAIDEHHGNTIRTVALRGYGLFLTPFFRDPADDMHDNQSDDDRVISKSQKKREMLALQELGKELTKHAPARLKKIPMSDGLREALNEMHRITANGARARQLQYIGKLMRTEETEPIRAGLEALAGKSHSETARMHRLEALRERFLEDETMLTEIGNLYPDADLHRLRQLRRNAMKERAENRPPKAYREIFQILRSFEEGVFPSDHPHHNSHAEGAQVSPAANDEDGDDE
jgi:ribosome-associated protein